MGGHYCIRGLSQFWSISLSLILNLLPSCLYLIHFVEAEVGKAKTTRSYIHVKKVERWMHWNNRPRKMDKGKKMRMAIIFIHNLLHLDTESSVQKLIQFNQIAAFIYKSLQIMIVHQSGGSPTVLKQLHTVINIFVPF